MNTLPFAPGVGPHPKPWPADSCYDPQLLEHGDARNVVDKYHYWTVEAIKADLATTRTTLEVAIENWEHDLNIGTIVRAANAFNVAKVHIIGRRHWNKRGAMVTDRYVEVEYHPNVAAFVSTVKGSAGEKAGGNGNEKHIIAVDNLPGSTALAGTLLPEYCVLVFGSEREGLSPELIAASEAMIHIEQFGSTRSLNAAQAAGIVMYAWQQQHVL